MSTSVSAVFFSNLKKKEKKKWKGSPVLLLPSRNLMDISYGMLQSQSLQMKEKKIQIWKYEVNYSV